MKSQVIITLTSDELTEEQEQYTNELFNAPALLNKTKEQYKEIIEELFKTKENNETVTVEFRKLEGEE